MPVVSEVVLLMFSSVVGIMLWPTEPNCLLLGYTYWLSFLISPNVVPQYGRGILLSLF